MAISSASLAHKPNPELDAMRTVYFDLAYFVLGVVLVVWAIVRHEPSIGSAGAGFLCGAAMVFLMSDYRDHLRRQLGRLTD